MDSDPRAIIVTIGLVATALAVAPAASADATSVCPRDPAPPCAQIEPGATTGDRDCDEENGSGSVSNTAIVWAGTFPVGTAT